MKISVCIPCYNRPSFAKEAIESAINQEPKPFEILIGDDSTDTETEKMVSAIKNSLVKIRYWHNLPSLGQAKNVQQLFEQADGDLITLMHDDDRYRPGAFKTLIQPFFESSEIIASFGKQVIVSELGLEDWEGSQSINNSYNRIDAMSGLVRNSVEAGARSMFPNNGFFVRKDFARSIDYFANGTAGAACDFYFGFRLGLLCRPFYFCNEFTCDYRLTEISSARSGKSDSGYRAFKIIMEELEKKNITPELSEQLRERVKVAIAQGSKINKKLAWKWYFSNWHRSAILTPGGIRRLLLLLNIL